MRLPDDGKLGHGSQVDEGLAGFNAGFDDACSQQQPATGICRAAGDGREGRGEEPAGGGERDGYACPGFRADTFEFGFYSSDEEIADGAGRLCALRCQDLRRTGEGERTASFHPGLESLGCK